MRRTGSKSAVFKGTAMHTVGGLTRKDIVQNKTTDGKNKYASRKRSSKGRKNLWMKACAEARKQLNIDGFQLVKKGTPYYTRATEIHNIMKQQVGGQKTPRKKSSKKKSSRKKK